MIRQNVLVDRGRDKIDFLRAHGGGDFSLEPLGQDCSNRLYTRIHATRSWIAPHVLLVDDPDSKNADQFCAIAGYLSSLGLRVPEVYANSGDGFLLIEDFGATDYRALLQDPQQDHNALWQNLMETLVTLQVKTGVAGNILFQKGEIDSHLKASVPNVNVMTSQTLLQEVEIFLDWGLSYIGSALTISARAQALALWEKFLRPLDAFLPKSGGACVLVHKDFHTENVMKLSGHGTSSCGLLDFQDALWGPPSYDLVSLIEDVRLPFDEARIDQQRQRFIKNHPIFSPDVFEATYAQLSLQRSVKIFGVFSRLALRDPRFKTVDYLANVWLFIQKALKDSDASELSCWFDELSFQERLEAF